MNHTAVQTSLMVNVICGPDTRRFVVAKTLL